MSEALAKAPHAEDCSFQRVCDGVDWAARHSGLCNCYLSTLPDAVARGKKILEDLADLGRLRSALVLLAEKNL